MINTRDATELRKETLPNANGTVSILQLPDGRVIIKRWAARGKVINLLDRYEPDEQTAMLTVEVAHQIVDRLLAGMPWSDCFLFGARPASPLAWQRSREEHRYTSTGIKFWRHRKAMESYRAGAGRSVISTHISPEGACNLRCSYCSVTYRDTHSRIPLSRVQRYVTDLQSRGLKAVILTGGGEPTLYPEFNQLVRWLKRSLGLSVALITNGTTADRVDASTWRCFSWVRVSINVFDGWRERIRLPVYLADEGVVVGASFVYSIEHEASENIPLSRVDVFREVGEVASKLRAQYVRVLPNCLLEQDRLIREHHLLRQDLEQLGDRRFFQQYKVHAAPNAPICHQAYFRPYLSEEPFVGPDGKGDGEPGTVYPCDSVVLNDSVAHFGRKWQLCKPENVLDFLDGKISQAFDPRQACSGCVFTSNVEMLEAWKERGEGEFPDVHEEFV